MFLKRMFLALALAGLCAAPGQAASFGLFGSYWDTKDADHGFGGGIRSSADFNPAVSLDFGATYFNDLTKGAGHRDFKLHATPLDLGVSFHLRNDGGVQPYFGGGGTYYLLSSNGASISDEVGWYAKGGVEVGSGSPRFFAEAVYRDVSATMRFRNDELPDVIDHARLQLRGMGANAGILWHW